MAAKQTTNRESQDLILYQIREMRTALDKGLASIETRHTMFESRLASLERGQMKMEFELVNIKTVEKPDKEDESNFDQLVKVILKFAGVIATALAIAYAVLNK